MILFDSRYDDYSTFKLISKRVLEFLFQPESSELLPGVKVIYDRQDSVVDFAVYKKEDFEITIVLKPSPRIIVEK